MRAKTGVAGIFLLALGALVVSSTRARTAEAHSSAGQGSKLASVQISAPVIHVPAVAAPAAVTVVVPVAAATEIITPPPADPYLEDPKLRRMKPNEISKRMLEVAAKIVREHYAKPVGTLIEVDVGGQRVIARIERHFHPEGGAIKPWGFHPGVSLFAPR
ncbi:MAG TPA: hypothetical protein VER11_14030 [Polyangiaceae bacterium]|nr:hypothetical protein [Polyangiaceae bacterium]